MRIFIGVLFVSFFFINVYESNAYQITNLIYEVSPPIGDAHPQVNELTGEILTFAEAGSDGFGDLSNFSYDSFGQASVSGDLYIQGVFPGTNQQIFLEIVHEGELMAFGDGSSAESQLEFNIQFQGGWDFYYNSMISIDSFGDVNADIYYENWDGMTHLMDYRNLYDSTWFSIILVPGTYHFSYSMFSQATVDEFSYTEENPSYAFSDFSHTGNVNFYDINDLPQGAPQDYILEVSSQPVPEPVPEPTTILLFGIGLVGLVGGRLWRKK
jgi:hypothetical protein